MAKWFEPTGDSYFSHINRQSIEAVIREAKGDQAALAVKAAGKKFDDHLHRVGSSGDHDLHGPHSGNNRLQNWNSRLALSIALQMRL
ncbi:hypothetical protein [Mesorhizobium sp. M0019]|uniref:hypothetical protein n=1 Tax=unclassified Mesorhizobium TaxID=325217 RepID=UPI003338269F